MPPRNLIVSSKLNQIVLKSVANRIRSKQPLTSAMWSDIADEISVEFYTIKTAEVTKIFHNSILPNLNERNYGVTDQSTLEVIRNIPSLIDSATEHQSPQFPFESPSSMELMVVPTFDSIFEFQEPLGSSTQFCQEQDPLKLSQGNPASQPAITTKETIEAWMEANCGDPPILTSMFPSTAPPDSPDSATEIEKSDSDPIIFSGSCKQRTPVQANSIKPAPQKSWKKFEFTDTEEIAPPLTLPVSPVEAELDLRPTRKPSQTSVKQSKKCEYSAEFQKVLDNVIAKRKAARKAKRRRTVSKSRNDENVVPKKVTWKNFVQLFAESEDEVTTSPRKQIPAEPKTIESTEVAMDVEPITAPQKAAPVEAPKKNSWKDFCFADSD